jgi:CelD/BcsL family acetyltransferase involved in cellulose biosynthesis
MSAPDLCSEHVVTRDARLVVERISTPAGLEQLGSEWLALFTRVEDALPFASPEWAVAWWKHLRRDRRWIRDSLEVHAIRRPSGELLAVAPMMLTERPALVGAPRLRILQFFGTDPNLTEVRGMLVDRAHEAAAVHALAAHLMRRAHEWDWVQWSGLRREGDALEEVEEFVSARVNKDTSAFVLPLAASWEEFHRGLGRNVKESLRKCYNSLKRDQLAWRFDVVQAPDEIPRALEELFVLHQQRAEATETVRHANVFATAEARRFAHEVCRALAARGAARVYRLEVDGRLVSARIGFVVGRRLHLYYSGYDLAFGKYSVMTTTVAEAFKHAIAQGIDSVNLSTGADTSKLRWHPTEVGYLDAVAVSPRVGSRLAYQAFTLGAQMRQRRSMGLPLLRGLRHG